MCFTLVLQTFDGFSKRQRRSEADTPINLFTVLILLSCLFLWVGCAPRTTTNNLEHVIHLPVSATKILFAIDSKAIFYARGHVADTSLHKMDIQGKTVQEVKLNGIFGDFVLDCSGQYLCVSTTTPLFGPDLEFGDRKISVFLIDTSTLEIINEVDVFETPGITTKCMLVFSASTNSWIILCDRDASLYVAAFDLETLKRTIQTFLSVQMPKDRHDVSFSGDNIYVIPCVHATIGFDFLGNSFIGDYELGIYSECAERSERSMLSKYFTGPLPGSVLTLGTYEKKKRFLVYEYDSDVLLSKLDGVTNLGTISRGGEHDFSRLYQRLIDISPDRTLALYLIPSSVPFMGKPTPQELLVISVTNMDIIASEVSHGQNILDTAIFSQCGSYIAVAGERRYPGSRHHYIDVYKIIGVK